MKFQGSRLPFDQLRSILTQFTPDFEIFPKTGNARPTPASKPFEVTVPTTMLSD